MKAKQSLGDKNGTLMIMAAYSILMVVILAVSIITLISRIKKQGSIPSYETITEYIYVQITDTEAKTDTQADETDGNEIFIIREHMGMIGVFSKDDELLMTLDVYIKTLPKADQGLLGKGFEVIGKSQLNSVIEDYTG